LITRELTERPEVSTFKNVHITGSDGEKIFKLAKEILNLKTLDRKRDSSKVLGDGNASTKIISILGEFFQKYH
jgi:UDP-N-acetylglucosamine 2-epimerase